MATPAGYGRPVPAFAGRASTLVPAAKTLLRWPLAAAGFLLCSGAGTAAAQPQQAYPGKPIRLIVGFAPGGSTDLIARVFAQKLSEAWGYTVVVDNRSGAGGVIGTELVSKAPADGYTLLMATAANAGQASLPARLPYDIVKSFTPVSLLVTSPWFLVANAAVPANSIKELIVLAKAKPGQLNYGSAGQGTTNHLTGVLFNMLAGTNIVHIPYKGSGAVLSDLLGGQVQLTYASYSTVAQHIKTEKLKLYGVTSPKRSAGAPDIPTISEAGVPGFDMCGWNGVIAPAGTPKHVVDKLSSFAAGSVGVGETRGYLIAQGHDPVANKPAEFATFIEQELVKYSRLNKAASVTPAN